MPAFASDDERFMRHALGVARRGLGRVAPNPAVGCVIVKGGQMVAAARTADGGRPHAERWALAQAGDARGATVYVTLEPCAHAGAAGSCAEALIAGGVARVVVACSDPDPRTDGEGIRRLRTAGIEVTEGVLATEAVAANAGFLKRVREGMPWLGLKLATSADGFMARRSGQPQWITGEAARAFGHLLRAEHDATITGIGTLLADDPQLACRLPGRGYAGNIRIVIDRQLRLPEASRLAEEAGQGKVWIVTDEGAPTEREAALAARGLRILRLAEVTPQGVMRRLGEEGLTRVLLEAGPTLSHAFLPYADRLHWFHAPEALGSEGAAFFLTPNRPEIAEKGWNITRSQVFGEDRYDQLDHLR